ncbi:CDC45-like protein [Peniophora sp. CONT]|nr:CDC45-like protein [Peniophora sp. CONT]
MFIQPPHQTDPGRASYGEAYSQILAAHRRNPHTAAASVVLLCAPDVDALCAARMLAELLRHDDVTHRIIPVAGLAHLATIRDELMNNPSMHTLIMLNMGAVLPLASEGLFGGCPNLTVHVLDSTRPIELANMFGGVGGNVGDDDDDEDGQRAEGDTRVLVWADGGADKIDELRSAWETVQWAGEDYDPSDEEDDLLDEEEDEEEEEEEEDREDDEDGMGSPTRKRRARGSPNRARKRRRPDKERAGLPTRDEMDMHRARLDKYERAGYSYGQSTAGTVYILATMLERVDNDFLWLAIIGLTHQYATSRISRTAYDSIRSLLADEVARLNAAPPSGDPHALAARGPDDYGLRAVDELRFALWRHWTLYDSMLHSSYVAGKLGVWKEAGRKRLTGLLAKMGFSVLQTQQLYAHMDTDLKKALREKLDDIAPEYGLLDLVYPSFVRCHGYATPPLSAADAVDGLSALLDAATGVRIEVEVDGARHGGEWFGGGKVWRANGRWNVNDEEGGKTDGNTENHDGENGAADDEENEGKENSEFTKNFWNAFDALSDIERLHAALGLAKAIHRATTRQASALMDRNEIRAARTHHFVPLRQGPDLPLFAHPGLLARLGLWLTDALRDRMAGRGGSNGGLGRRKRKGMPLLLACWREGKGTWMVVGLCASLEFGEVEKNDFGLRFADAKAASHARTRLGAFDTNVVEVNEQDFDRFVSELASEAY